MEIAPALYEIDKHFSPVTFPIISFNVKLLIRQRVLIDLG